MSTNQFGYPRDLLSTLGQSQHHGSGPWGHFNVSFPPHSCFIGRQIFNSGSTLNSDSSKITGSEGRGNRQAGGLLEMSSLTERSVVAEANDTTPSSDGNHGEKTSQGSLSHVVSQEEALKLSGSGRRNFKETAARQEERGNLSPEARDEVPNDYLSVPVDLSQKDRVPLSFDNNAGYECDDPFAVPKAANVMMKTKLEKNLQEKLDSSHYDYNQRFFQNYRYTREETTALLKAIAWKGHALILHDGLPMKDIMVHMKSGLFWDDNYNGQGSVLSKFRENISGIQNRDSSSLKNKWCRISETIAKTPFKFFLENAHMTAIDDKDKILLINLAKVCQIEKCVDILNQGTHQVPQPASMPPPPNSLGNPFLGEDPNQNGQTERDMPVFPSQWGTFTS